MILRVSVYERLADMIDRDIDQPVARGVTWIARIEPDGVINWVGAGAVHIATFWSVPC